jgi:hypothetical protein
MLPFWQMILERSSSQDSRASAHGGRMKEQGTQIHDKVASKFCTACWKQDRVVHSQNAEMDG